MIKLLADENFPLASIEILANNQYDILSISRFHSGMSDADIITLANQEQRLILTFDRDFGQLIFRMVCYLSLAYSIFDYSISIRNNLHKSFWIFFANRILKLKLQLQLSKKTL